MRRALVVASILSVCIGPLANARSCRDVDFPERVQVDGVNLSLNGLGIRKATFLKVHVYVGALYVMQPSHDSAALIDSKEPEQIVLHFVRSVDAADLRKGWREGFEHSAGARLPDLQARVEKLMAWMPDVQTGERLSFVRRPGAGIQVSVDGAVKGAIDGDDFARAFMAIWLGPSPPNPELKSGLLGGPCE